MKGRTRDHGHLSLHNDGHVHLVEELQLWNSTVLRVWASNVHNNGHVNNLVKLKAAQLALCVPVYVAKENVHQLGDGLSLRHLPQRLSLHNDGHAHLVQKLQL